MWQVFCWRTSKYLFSNISNFYVPNFHGDFVHSKADLCTYQFWWKEHAINRKGFLRPSADSMCGFFLLKIKELITCWLRNRKFNTTGGHIYVDERMICCQKDIFGKHRHVYIFHTLIQIHFIYLIYYFVIRMSYAMLLMIKCILFALIN